MSNKSKIMCVDDNDTNIAIYEEMLSETYILRTAKDGHEALDIAELFRPDLVLLDIMMPGIDGYETCRRIRANSNLRQAKIIMASAKAMTSERLTGYESGADDYITKPFDQDELLAKVRVYLRLKSIEEVEQLKGDVLALLAHETRTPLNGLIEPARMLMEKKGLNEGDRKSLTEMIYISANRLSDLIEKVLTLSAMKSGKKNFHFAVSDLCGVVQHAVAKMLPFATEQGVEIITEFPDPVSTSFDTAQITLALQMLLHNAIRFSPPNARVAVNVLVAQDDICLTVSNQGAGIAADLVPYVFDEFTIADIMHHTKGSGLSLAIARQIALAHDGSIEVESTPGVETTFTVRLPATVNAEIGKKVVMS